MDIQDLLSSLFSRFIETSFAEFQTSETVKLAAATPFAIFAVLSDIVVAGSLCALLHESRTGIGKTNRIITSLMIYAVNRCLLTSFVAIVEVIVFVARPHELWFLGVDFVIGKQCLPFGTVYANSLLASLNSRNMLRNQQGSGMMSTSIYISADSSDPSNASSGSRGSQGHAVLALKPMSRDGSTIDDGTPAFGSAGPKVSPDVFAV
ncbi:hypothetical protein AAF712_013262 [Marasmius tenuissimus]|uniref:DUF6534 domain-containing protein n=1 Tax=Marasmius tenuissimus TaxID=585030 RepID=A0ABR2ZEF7_9AGAR